MDCPQNCPLCRPNTAIIIFLKNLILILIGLLQAIYHGMNAQHRNREGVTVDVTHEANRGNVFRGDYIENTTSNDQQTWNEHSEDYDTEYPEDARRETWYDDYDDHDYIETVRDHDEHIVRHNYEHSTF